MTQLQISIEMQHGKMRVELNQLFREDATEEEVFIALQLEKTLVGVCSQAASDAGLKLKHETLAVNKAGE